MKIKEFADYFKVKKSTVRYYTDINLLIPEKSGSFSKYNDQCIKDMNDITRLKNMGFSIKQIQHLKLYGRFNINYFKEEHEHLDQIFSNKISELKNEIIELYNKIEDIKSYKQEICYEQEKKSIGVPLNALNLLRCPLCNDEFTIEGASISKNMIFSGILECKCGNRLNIYDGLITDSEESTKETPPLKNSPKRTMIKVTNEHIAQIKSSGNHIYNHMKNWDHSKGILFPNADSDLLIMKTDDIFKKSGLYFFASYDLISLKILKKKMEYLNLNGSFAFMHIGHDFPVSKEIEYIVDNGGNICDMIKNKKPGYSTKKLKPYVNSNSKWIRIHVGLSINDCPLSTSDKRREYLLLNEYNERIRAIGMKISDEFKIGSYKKIEGMEHLYWKIENLNLTFQDLKPY